MAKPTSETGQGAPSRLYTESEGEGREVMTWRGIVLQVRHRSNWLSTGFDHIEVEAMPREPLPITKTGYRSHFIDPGDLADYDGSAVTFVLFWLDTTAKREGWSGQKSLF